METVVDGGVGGHACKLSETGSFPKLLDDKRRAKKIQKKIELYVIDSCICIQITYTTTINAHTK